MSIRGKRKNSKSLPSMKKADSRFGFLLTIPAMLVFSFVILYPFIRSIFYSFTDESLLRDGETKWVGFDNFINFISSPYFLDTLTNTLIFVVITTLVPFVLAFAWTVVLVQGLKGEKLLRTLTLFCWILPSASVGLLWMWLLNTNHGIVNEVLMNIGIISKAINFLGDDRIALFAVSITMIWANFPWMMAFLIGGIQSVPPEQIEALRLDGGNNFKLLTHVMLPHMKAIISVILILSLIDRFQHFDLLWVMTEGGPARATTTFSIEVYKEAFQNFEIGKAAAVGMIWVVFLSILVFFYMRQTREDK